MSSSKLHYLPLGIFIIFPMTFIITYSIAVGKDHIYPFFSYISDTGTFPPEMNIFAQLLNIAGVIIGATAYVRYKQVEEFHRQNYTSKLARTNKAGLVFGIIAAFGSSVVGNFQETNVISVHVIGAIMAFGGGSIFLIIQAYFTFKMVAFFGSKSLGYLRMGLGISCLILFIISYGTGTISLKYFDGDKAVKWDPEDGGFVLHVISVVTEWTMAALFDLYFLTLIPEFKKVTFEGPKFSLVKNVDGVKDNGAQKTTMMQRVGEDET